MMEKQKVVLITGCSSGIGLATAVYLAQNGLKVYASMRDLGKKGALVSDAKRAGVPMQLVRLDVTDERSVKKAVEGILKREGRIDTLVNNAGFGSGGFLEDVSMEEAREQFETNFFGVVRVTKAVLPAMRMQKGGCIVNISSIGGLIAFPVLSMYNASKFAVEALTESLRVELAPFGIKAAAIEPGSIKSNFNSSVHVAKKAEGNSSPYLGLMARFRSNIEKMAGNAEDPVVVARAVHAAISSKSPKRHYLAGKSALVLVLMKKIMPAGVFEKMIGKVMLG